MVYMTSDVKRGRNAEVKAQAEAKTLRSSLQARGQHFVKSIYANLITNGTRLSPEHSILMNVNKKVRPKPIIIQSS